MGPGALPSGEIEPGRSLSTLARKGAGPRRYSSAPPTVVGGIQPATPWGIAHLVRGSLGQPSHLLLSRVALTGPV